MNTTHELKKSLRENKIVSTEVLSQSMWMTKQGEKRTLVTLQSLQRKENVTEEVPGENIWSTP